jgi:hypothetical protein
MASTKLQEGTCDRCGRKGRVDVPGQPGTPCPDYCCHGVLVPEEEG